MDPLFLQGKKKKLHERLDIPKTTTTKGYIRSKKIRYMITGPDKRGGSIQKNKKQNIHRRRRQPLRNNITPSKD